jgi:hypothetical protein
VPWLRRLVSSLLQRRAGFDLRAAHVRCGGQVALGLGLWWTEWHRDWVCGGQVALGLDWVSSSTSGSPCEYHSNSALYSSLSTRCSYQKGKREKTGKLPKRQRSFANRVALDRNVSLNDQSQEAETPDNSTLQNKTVPTANVAYKNWCRRWRRHSALQNIRTVAVGGKVQ